MPKSKLSPKVSITDQIRKLAEDVRQAADAHAAMDARMKKIETLSQRVALAVSKHSASVSNLLNQASSKPTETKLFAKLRALETAFNSQYLQLRSQMQRENQVFTSVSNVLKTRHDTAKNSIGNIR